MRPTPTLIKICDFGIAGLCAGHKSEITNAGSLNYLPPEHFTGKKVAAGPTLDIWAIGCMTYAMLYGHLPFQGKTVQEIRQRISHDSVDFPEKPVVTDMVKDLILKMLEKDPEMRITMRDIKEHPWSKVTALNGELEKQFQEQMSGGVVEKNEVLDAINKRKAEDEKKRMQEMNKKTESNSKMPISYFHLYKSTAQFIF